MYKISKSQSLSKISKSQSLIDYLILQIRFKLLEEDDRGEEEERWQRSLRLVEKGRWWLILSRTKIYSCQLINLTLNFDFDPRCQRRETAMKKRSDGSGGCDWRRRILVEDCGRWQKKQWGKMRVGIFQKAEEDNATVCLFYTN